MDRQAAFAIGCEQEYDNALAAADALMDASPNSPEGERLQRLVSAIEEYEAGHWAIGS
jgi:antitoxin component HigA of HigAB toxin-antitoxin module